MAGTKLRVLAVDDDREFLSDLTALMKSYDVTKAYSGREALDAIAGSSFDVVLLDVSLGQGPSGLEVLEKTRALDPDLPVIMVTRDTTAATAVAALKKGAVDYIDKKPDLDDLERRISKAIEERRLHRENAALRSEIATLKGRMIGEGPAMNGLREEIRLAAQGANPVLITGETGTGKELVARAIHEASRPGKPFVAINCAAVPRELFESHLFGSERGAFTGADRRIIGFFELAGQGVLFLDEITEMDVALQAKILRAVEERQFNRLGGSQPIEFKARLLASSNRDLILAMGQGRLRQDLYFRLSTYVIKVPPLRDRREDIPALVSYFLERKGVELKKTAPQLGPEMIERMCSYDWPGNVRELENAMEALVVRGRLVIGGAGIAGVAGDAAKGDEDVFTLPYNEARTRVLERFQKKYVAAVLAACGGDTLSAAGRMGLTRFGLQKLIKRLGIF